MKKTKLLVALCLVGSMGFAQFNNVVNIAGTGSAGVGTPQPNNLGTAATAPLAIKNIIGGPTGVVVDHSGNVYYIDNGNNCIMKINHASGTVNLVAGTYNASPGYYDDGIAGHALFNRAASLCLDASGNLYISDSRNYIIRMIKPNTGGVINSSCSIVTVAGTPGVSCSASCGDGGIATNAFLNLPTGMAIDQSGNLFFGDVWSIRKVTNPSTPGSSSIISAVLGSGASALTLDPVNGDLYFASSSKQVYRIQAVGGTIPTSPTALLFAGSPTATTLGDNGPAVNASFQLITGLAVDANQNVYIADNQDDRIRKVSANTITTVAGTGSTGTFNYSAPSGNSPGVNITPYNLTTDACGSVYFSDNHSQVIGKLANPVTFAPNFPLTTMSVCSGSVFNASVNSGSNVSTIYPDSYTWALISANSSWAPDGGGNVANGTISNPGSNSISIPVSTTGLTCNHNYILQVTASKTCPVLSVATATAHVTINCSPAPVISGNTTICSGSSTTLCETLSGSPYTINWTIVPSGSSVGSTSCITVSPTANTTYKVGITNTANGCYGSATQLVTVQNIAPIFNLNATGTSSNTYTIEATNPTYFTQAAVPGFGYSWDVKEVQVGNSAVTISNTEVSAPSCWQVPGGPVWFWGYQGTGTLSSCNQTPAGVGVFKQGHEYLVTYTDWSNACPAKSYPYIGYLCNTCRLSGEGSLMPHLTDAEILGIHKQDIESATEIYPNPTNGNFTIETPFTTKQTLQVFDITGRVVLTQTINGTATIDASSLTSGVYNVSITNNEGVINKRLIISK